MFLVAGSGLTDSIRGPKVNKVIQQWHTNFCTSCLTGVCSAHRGKLARGSFHLYHGGHYSTEKVVRREFPLCWMIWEKMSGGVQSWDFERVCFHLEL